MKKLASIKTRITIWYTSLVFVIIAVVLTVVGVLSYRLSIDNIEKDFPGMPKAFIAYIRLKSYQRKQTRVSSRINKLKKYYQKPTELFARFIEGLYLDKEWVEALAPKVSDIFKSKYLQGEFEEFSTVFDILNIKF